MRFCLSAPIVVLSILLVFSACKESEKPGAKSDALAGKAIEVFGEVHATRASGKPRLLTEGADVFADDKVTTGADSSVAILLAHNGAVHDIGADQSVTIKGSLAWNLKKAKRRVNLTLPVPTTALPPPLPTRRMRPEIRQT